MNATQLIKTATVRFYLYRNLSVAFSAKNKFTCVWFYGYINNSMTVSRPVLQSRCSFRSQQNT